MNNDDSWEKVEVPENQEVNYEIEEEVPQEAAPPEKEEDPKELEGIQTKGAEKRIRQLVRQRKERDDQISQLMARETVSEPEGWVEGGSTPPKADSSGEPDSANESRQLLLGRWTTRPRGQRWTRIVCVQSV